MYIGRTQRVGDALYIEMVLPGRITPSEMPDILNEYMAELVMHDVNRVVFFGKFPAWLAGAFGVVSRSLGVIPCIHDSRSGKGVCADGVILDLAYRYGRPCPSLYLLGGPPKSGKTYSMSKINDALFPTGILYEVIEANVDLEGAWAAYIGRVPRWMKEVKRSLITRYGDFVTEMINHTVNAVNNGYAVISSLGGMPSIENRYYISTTVREVVSNGYPAMLLVLKPRTEKYAHLLSGWLELASDVCEGLGCRYEVLTSQEAIEVVTSDVVERCLV